MAKKKADRFNYALAQKKLRKFGWDFKAKTKPQKTKLKSFWKSKAAYVNYIEKDRLVDVTTGVIKGLKKKKGRQKLVHKSTLEYRFKFQRLGKKQMISAKKSGLFSDQQFTPTGIFIERPINIPAKDYKVSFHKNSIEITADCRHDEIVAVDANILAIDPARAIQEAIESRKCLTKGGRQKKVKAYSLMVNGFRSKHSSSSAKVFMYYIKNILLPEWLEKNKYEENPAGKFADIFHVRLLYSRA